MALDGSYTFAGIGAAEAKTRENEHRSGVPPVGAGPGPVSLLTFPVRRTTGIRLVNQGGADAWLCLGHGNKEKAVTGELLIANRISSTVYRGKLQYGSIKPTTVSITAAAGPAPLTDPDGDGILQDAALAARGTINYVTGEFSITFASAVTEPVVAAYTHTAFTQFESATQTNTKAAAAYPFTMSVAFGRVAPRTVTLTDTSVTFVDDGKGNMVETTGGIAVVRGSIDYATGVVILTGGTAPLGGTVTATIKFNPLAALLVRGGGMQGAQIISDAIPELGSEVYADGVKGESTLSIMGISRAGGERPTTDIVAYVGHHVEEPYRVAEDYSAFPPGGASNDPRVSGS